MKRFWFLAGIFFFLSLWAVSACGCFHDTINVVNKAGYITRWAYVYNVACYQGGQTKIATLPKWTKVRIIWQSAYTKIVMPDGKVGRVGNDRVAESSDRSGVPAFPANHKVDSYCDTTNPSKCPVPIPPGVPITQWTYNNDAGVSTPTPTDPTPTPTYKPPVSKVIPVTDSLKPKLDMMANNVVSKVDVKYGGNMNGKISHYKNLLLALKSIQSSSEQLQDLVGYLITKFEETLSLLELENLLDVN